jgi:hypothetical protein
MNPLLRRCLALCSISLPAAGALAQPVEIPWRSTLETYRRFADEPVAPWRESNDTVRRIGGWREYAKEAHPPAAGKPQAPASAPASAPSRPADPHSGHHKP